LFILLTHLCAGIKEMRQAITLRSSCVIVEKKLSEDSRPGRTGGKGETAGRGGQEQVEGKSLVLRMGADVDVAWGNIGKGCGQG
jgi:hypothetical protein